MKTKILFIGITMNCAGSEKSFLSFINTLDESRFDVTLLLAKKEGLFLEQLPSFVKVKVMEGYGDIFTLSGKNAFANIGKVMLKSPSALFTVLPFFVRLLFDRKNRASVATRMWIALMRRMPEVKEEYDAAVAYWGDRTMFYMIDKVKAKQKITWLHFDYSFPKRDNGIYLPYFERCNAIVNVSAAVDDALKRELPAIKDKCLVIENINHAGLIGKMAESGKGFTDGYTGKRILTVGRIADQKGYDFAIPAFARLKKEGVHARWYVLGSGDDDYVAMIRGMVKEYGLEDDFILLGVTGNPYPYMKQCDIYAQPSRYEGKPISVEEAKILQKPILVCRYLSAEEQLENGRLGRIEDIGEEGVYRGLKALLSDDGLCDGYRREVEKRDFSNTDEINKFYALL